MVPNITPPKSPEAEALVLSLLLRAADDSDEVIERFGGREVFYDPTFDFIFQKIHSLYHAGGDISAEAVMRKLRQDGMSRADQAEYAMVISKLSQTVYRNDELLPCAEELIELQVKREMLTHNILLSDAIERNLPLEEIVSMSNTLYDVSQPVRTQHITTMADSTNEVLRRMEIALAAETSLTGIPIGIRAVDKYTGGWQPTDVIGIMGSTGQGKTAIATIATEESARAGFPTAYITLEMPGFGITRRMISRNAKVPYRDIRDAKKLADHQIKEVHRAIGKIERLPIYYYDEGPRDFVSNVRPWIRKVVKKYGVKMVVIDYLQLMKWGKVTNIYERVSLLSAAVKELQMELGIPIIVVLQMNREAGKRSVAKPELTDIRDSGQIEQDLSVCIGGYREDYYNFLEKSKEGRANEFVSNNQMELIILKNREGSIGCDGPCYCEIQNNIITDMPDKQPVFRELPKPRTFSWD